MYEVDQIVEEVLLESGFDWDHPVVPYLVEDVEQMLYELSRDKIDNYQHRSRLWRNHRKYDSAKGTPEHSKKYSPDKKRNRDVGSRRALARMDSIEKSTGGAVRGLLKAAPSLKPHKVSLQRSNIPKKRVSNYARHGTPGEDSPKWGYLIRNKEKKDRKTDVYKTSKKFIRNTGTYRR